MQNNKELNNYNVHDHYKHCALDTLKQINQQSSIGFAVCLINLRGDLNIGMLIRSACLLGAEKIIIMGKRSFDRRSCVGSQNYIPIEKVGEYNDNGTTDPKLFQQTMINNNYTPIFIETGGEPIQNLNLESISYNTKPCLVLGCEANGIDPEIIKNSHNIYSIPQLGVLRSFNVASAGAIAMWEISQKLFC